MKKKILVTGASGFIGRHICEVLLNTNKYLPVALEHLNPITIKGVKKIKGDVLDLNSLKFSLKDCHAVIHCANSYDSSLNWNVSVKGTGNICKFCLDLKLSKLIYLSSASVYGFDLPSIVNESTQYNKINGDIYNNSKIYAEKIVNHFIDKYKLPAVILQPTIVYGPHSIPWTIDPINKIKNGNFLWMSILQGNANPIYINDLTEAVLLALENKKAIGKTFIISGGEIVSWKDFFKPYFKFAGKSLPKKTNKDSNLSASYFYFLSMIRNILNIANIVKKIPNNIKGPFKNFYRTFLQIEEIKNNEDFLKRYAYKAYFDITKANKILGFQPKVNFNKGMTLTKKWFLKNKKYVFEYDYY